MNKAAQALGRRAKGIPKTFSLAELARRRKQMRALNQARADKLKQSKTSP